MGETARRDEPLPSPGLVEEPLRGGPTALRMILGGQLKKLREANGVSRKKAAELIRGSEAKICRLELGRTGYKQRDVADLLTLYGIEDRHERQAYLALARNASSAGWWNKYSDVLPSWVEMYLGLEQAASVIRGYQLQLVPGLFQTADYARAVTRLGHPGASSEEVEQRVDLRLRRQRILTVPGAPQVWAVVDEAALRRPIGGSDIMRAQLERLLELNTLPNVTIQVVPFRAGGHVMTGGPFTILRFADLNIKDVVYLEQLTSAHYLDKSSDVDTYAIVMDQLSVVAASAGDTREFLENLIEV